LGEVLNLKGGKKTPVLFKTRGGYTTETGFFFRAEFWVLRAAPKNNRKLLFWGNNFCGEPAWGD